MVSPTGGNPVNSDVMFQSTSASSTWLLNLFLNNIWLAIAFWAGLFFLDYVFAMTQTRLYRDGAQGHYGFSGGVELSPLFWGDANTRKFSLRFFLLLFLFAGLLLIVYQLKLPTGFAVVWGMVIGVQLANHCRHLRNLTVLYYARRSAGVSGKVEYEHWFSLRSSAVEYFSFGLLFLFLFLCWGNMFAVGATTGCLLVALQHLVDSMKNRKSTPKVET